MNPPAFLTAHTAILEALPHPLLDSLNLIAAAPSSPSTSFNKLSNSTHFRIRLTVFPLLSVYQRVRREDYSYFYNRYRFYANYIILLGEYINGKLGNLTIYREYM